MPEDPRLQDLSADVLVVGGGLAALRAAYEALRAGARVILAVKGKAGRSGSSAMTSAGYSSAGSTDDSADLHFSDTMTGGKGINDERLVRILTEEAPERLSELIELGVPLATRGNERLRYASGDHSVPRVHVSVRHTGRDFTEPLTRAVVERGCVLLEQTAALEVLLEADHVVGALVLDYERETLIRIAAPAVILATGGAGRIFAVTSNPNDATGDGYALALRAGVDLRDMEFIQFYPWRCIIPFGATRMPIQPSTFVHGGKLFNNLGERFMLRYDSVRAEHTTRDLAARGIYEEIRSGRDIKGGVRLDLTDLSDDDWALTNPRPASYFSQRGLDFRAEEMILAPEAHFFMGGAVIDEAAETEIAGLYAVGEVAGGVHGANRLDSNAVPETQVFGTRAGRAAADRASRGASPGLPVVGSWARRFGAALRRSTGRPERYQTIRAELQAANWETLGIIRDSTHLREGLARVSALEANLAELEPAGARQLMEHVTLENSMLVARACLTAAAARVESRGAHYRSDFPEQDDVRWRVSQHVRLGRAGELELQSVEMATAGR